MDVSLDMDESMRVTNFPTGGMASLLHRQRKSVTGGVGGSSMPYGIYGRRGTCTFSRRYYGVCSISNMSTKHKPQSNISYCGFI